MKYKHVKKTLRFTNIDWQDNRFRMSYFSDLTTLKRSILKVGIVYPPLLQQISRNRYRIISGWRRLLVLKELQKEPFEVFVLDEKITELQLFEHMLHENLSIRDFNLIEKAQILNRLETDFRLSEMEMSKSYLPQLKLAKSNQWNFWLTHLLDFPASVQQAFAEDKLSFDLVEYMVKYKNQEKIYLTQLILSMHLSKSRQKELMIFVGDLLRIKRISLSKLLEQTTILKDNKLTYSQKTTKFFHWLKSQRYPNYSETEKKFLDSLKACKLPNKMQIKHSPFFESDWLTLQFQFRNPDEFRQAVQIQTKLIEENHIHELLRWFDTE